jgi:NTE family protein/lysophospholipid hydrolase
VGLVLGGGGARGFAHIGVLRAMEEAGIPVDAIGGTSMGAGIAAHHALGLRADEVKTSNRRIFLELKPHHDFTLPVFSFVGARKAEEAGWKVYGTTEIEDLWIPYFCVSSDLSSAEMVVHRRGLLWKAALASASLPAFTTPVLHEGHLLVDGALLNNLPSDVMRRLGPGVVIASEVSVEEDDAFCCDRIPTSWEALKGRWWGKKGEKRFPSLMEVVLRASLLHSTWRERMAVQEADLCLRPPVEAFGLLDFERLDDLVAIGYDYAREALAAWAEGGGALPRETATPAEVASVLQAALAPGA